MFEPLEISRRAHALASHAMTRQGAIAANVANADTPGYKATDVVDFATAYRQQAPFQPLATRAAHLMTPDPKQKFEIAARRVPGNESPNGNTVALEREMMKGAEARQSFDMALAIAKSASGIVRASIGRR